MRFALAFVTVLAVCAVASAGVAPPPKTAVGKTATLVARGVKTPTAFAFAYGRVFVSGYGDWDDRSVIGGVYVLRAGKAVRLAQSPPHVRGLASSNGTVYVSAEQHLLAWSGWNGTRFTKTRVVFTGDAGFPGFQGITVGPDRMIYAGVGGDSDTQRGTGPYANSVVRVDPASGAANVVATGMRQPWQPLFVPGRPAPLVSDLGQDDLGPKRPPDWVVWATQGADFGFPTCPADPTSCTGHTKPFLVFPPHASPMGLAYLGGRIYVALFTGTTRGPEVVRVSVKGGRVASFMTRFPANLVALAVNAGSLYTGDLSGSIYRVRP